MAAYADGLSIRVELTEFASDEIRKLGMLADQAIVAATPFKDGQAKANWLMSINEPETRINENTSTFNASGSYSIDLARTVTESYPSDSLPVLWIVNNLPYIVPLNTGTSAQAGEMFVETAIAQAVSYGG